ncbi:hypothetical protein CC80DRAFT_517518 [Byssothecium circinans]|uniref:Tat pathway signal sequence n=1 Tax=Byssothecium circinans TaxID=147558 RepID=A0A6A5U090_9PLEO|nr:hypothetical protein CC80DRAFT_517518 [Byssothecium circinans]
MPLPWSSPKSSHSRQQLPEPKRISTPAGQRLSIILESGNRDAPKKARDSHRASVRKSGLSAALADVPRESMEEKSGNGSGYSYSVWSDGGNKLSALKNHKAIAKRGGWRRVAMVLALVLLFIIALAVGLAVGLKKPKSASSSNPTEDSASPTTAPSPSSSTSSPPISLPADFPLGTYSLITFLDTVQTPCTANPSAWTCSPYTTYYNDKQTSVATFHFIISGSADAYKVSTTGDNQFGISFRNAALTLLDKGKDTERYRFQIQTTKTVDPGGNMTGTQCKFYNTNLQAVLYTKMARSWPDTKIGDPDGNATNTEWPFAVRIEQSVSGGENVPVCYKKANGGQQGEQISLATQDGGTLCSCLYKNWHTPS